MKSIFLMLLAVLLAVPASTAQNSYATVTGTVVGPAGNPLSAAALTATLVNSAGQQIQMPVKLSDGTLYNGSPTRAFLDSTGHFSISIPTNPSVSSPPNSQWSFVITAPTGPSIVVYPAAWNITYATPISGSTDLSAAISAQLTGPISFVYPQTGQAGFSSVTTATQSILPTVVSALPAAVSSNRYFHRTVSDGNSATDCTVGGGSTAVDCWNPTGSTWTAFGANGGGSPTGAAGGDLGSTYPNPSVVKVNGAVVPASQPCLGSNGSSQLINGTCGTTVNVNGGAVANPNFNATTPAAPGFGGVNITPQVSGSNVSHYLPGVSVGNEGSNWFFGDSTMEGDGKYAGLQWFLSQDMFGVPQPFGVGGTFASDGATSALKNYDRNYPTAVQLPKFVVNYGINEANNYLASNTGALNNFYQQMTALTSWLEIPVGNLVYGTQCTKTSGSWTNSNHLAIHASNAGGETASTTNSSVLTCTSVSDGSNVAIFYYVPVAANGGTFTVSIDGVLQTDSCSGTTTFSATGCNAIAVKSNTMHAQIFPVSAGSTHSVAFTATSTTSASNIDGIIAIGTTPAAKTLEGPLMYAGVIREASDTNSAATAAFNTQESNLYTAVLPWAKVGFADVRTGSPGVNTTTDMGPQASIGCYGSQSSPLHANGCGYIHWAQTIESTASAAGFNMFFPGAGKNIGYAPSMGDLTVGTGILTDTFGKINSYYNFNTSGTAVSTIGMSINGGFNATGCVPSATVFCPWFSVFGSAPIQVDGLALGFDVANSAFTTSVLTSQAENGFEFCPTSLTTAHNGCHVDNYETTADGIWHTKTGLQTALFKTLTNCASGASPAVCAAAPAGAVAIPTGTNSTLVVNTTAVTANSEILLTVDDSLTIGGTTCNSTLATLVGGVAITARTAATSFTISYNGTITTNPLCLSYTITN